MTQTYVYGYDEERAMAFNDRAAISLGWKNLIPTEAAEKWPDLDANPNGKLSQKRKFAKAVFEMQKELFGNSDEADGMLGNNTKKAMLMRFAYVGDDQRHLVHNGVRMELNAAEDYTLHTFEHPYGLDLHKSGWRRSSKREVRFIVLHWGGLDAPQCRGVLRNRELSSHFGIDRSGVYQWLDTSLVAWHAGKANTHSIGIDICQQPTTKYHDYYLKRGHDVKVIDNPDRVYKGLKRGDRKVLTLDPVIAENTRRLIKDLCDAFDIPFRTPRGEDGYGISTDPHFMGVLPAHHMKEVRFRGIVGHAHVSRGKWDCHPFWRQLFGE